MHMDDNTIQKRHFRMFELFQYRYSRYVLKGMEVGMDFIVIYASIIGSYWIYTFWFNRYLPGGFGYYSDLGLSAGVIGVSAFCYNGLCWRRVSMMSIMNLLETRRIIRTTFVLFLLLILYLYFTNAHYSRLILFFTFCLLLILLPTGRFLFFKFNQYLYAHKVNVRNVMIFGAGEAGRLLYQSISHTPRLGFFPLGFFDMEIEGNEILENIFCSDNNESILCIDDFNECLRIIKEYKVCDIFLSDPMFKRQGGNYWQQLLIFCSNHQIQLHFVPYLQHILAERVILDELNGIPVVSFNDMSSGRIERMVKRSFDLVVGISMMIVIAPLMAIISVLIKRDSKGPILFKQKRVGKNNTLFTIYKFRTMYVDTPDFQNSPTMTDDTRITRIGRLLRKMSMDELPQILNVIQGTMSLVGPRPEMPFIVESEYNELHRQRLCVKPGITGIWQISTDRKREIHEDISYDLFYIANRSLLLDILIIFRTVPALFCMRTC